MVRLWPGDILNCVSCFWWKKHTTCKWKDAIAGFPVSPDDAEALVGWGEKIKYILIAYFLGNICARNCRNRTMKHILRLVNYCKNTITSTQPTFLPWRFGLYQRRSSEEVCSIPLPVLAMIVMRRGKKSVVRVAQRIRKHQVPVAVRPIKALKSLLVHPKDKQEKEEITDCVYKIPCASCEKCYIGETGRKFATRLKEHKIEVESITSKPFTRNQRASSLSEQNKSALTDHASYDNRVINWPAFTILDRESDNSIRWIKEAVHIRTGGRQSLNRGKGRFTLSHTYDRFLATSHHYRGKNRKRNWTNFFWWTSLIKTKTSR